jgi:hypothetical protein
MIPKSVSASSLHTAELCMARWKAEYFERGRGESGDAALHGTVCHEALENYVKTVVIGGNGEQNIKTLLDFYRMSYMTMIDSTCAGEKFDKGVEWLTNWFKRTDFSLFEVISCEVKSSFPIPTSIGNIQFNYIWDRFDKIGPTEYRVVDYKTSAWNINHDDLKKKLQARAYAVAAAIQLKNEGKEVTKIWVEFDMLAHNNPIGIVFSREENAAAWEYMKRLTQEIVDTDPDFAQETINPECNFCVRKTSCGALQRNIKVGGVFAHGSIEDKIDLRAQLEWQKKGLAAAVTEIDRVILEEARERNEHEFMSGANRLKITVSGRRSVDPERVEMVLGDELFKKYGGRSFTVGNVDKLLKGDELTDQQKALLRSLIYFNTGEPKVTIEARNMMDGD